MSEDSETREVFFVIGSLQVGGTEMHLSMVARELVKHRCIVTVYNLTGTGGLGDAMSEAGVEVVCPPVKSMTGILRILNPVCLCLSSLKLFLIFLFHRPKIVHFFLPQAYIIGAIMARCAGLSGLIMSRRSLNHYQQRHPLLKLFERKLHAHMKAVLGNSRAVISQLHQEENVPNEKLHLLYNGIAFDRFDAPLDQARKRKDLGIAPGTLVLAIIANLIPYKGHCDLLRALSEIQGEMPDNWILLAIGRDDGIGESLKRKAATLGLGENVRFLGSRDDVPDILRLSNLGILCSHEEGFSNAILEGMAAGLPLVVTDVGGNCEAVVNRETGLVVPARSPAGLGAAILKLAKDAQMRERMGAKAKKRVSREFSLEACVARYEALYEDIRSEQ